MNRSIEHQDASGHMPLGAFLNGELLAVIPRDDTYGYATIERIAAERGIEPRGMEALVLCQNHPDVPAVDCIDCVPLD